MNSEQLLCKDCQHSRAKWHTRILNDSYGWSCELDYCEPRVNPVTGCITSGFYHSCAATRTDINICGPTAKAWQPRTKKDLFTLLRVVR